MCDDFAIQIVGLSAVEIRQHAERFVDAFTGRMRSGS
jgi:hypothetical protein